MEFIILLFFIVFLMYVINLLISKNPDGTYGPDINRSKDTSKLTSTKSSSSSIEETKRNTSKSKIEKCIAEQKDITFFYKGRTGKISKKSRTMTPSLIFWQPPSSFYGHPVSAGFRVTGFCHLRNTERTYFLKRMIKIKIV